MKIVDFTLNSNEENLTSFINDQYRIVKEAIEDSKNVELTISFESIFDGEIANFNDVEWKEFPLPQLDIKDKTKLVLVENLVNENSYKEHLKNCMSHLIKKLIILGLQPYLLIVPNQTDVELSEKLVRLRIEFN